MGVAVKKIGWQSTFVISVCALLCTFAAQAQSAEPAAAKSTIDKIRAQVEAGEFAPAVQLARQAADPLERDQLLGWIAQQQAKAGAATVALTTASDIDNESTRAAAYSNLRTSSAGRQGARGGSAEPDFESVIDLITSTVKPTSWDLVGGPGSIKGFASGVHVDAEGVLRRVVVKDNGELTIDALGLTRRVTDNSDIRRKSGLRKVSLARLEREVQARLAAGQQPLEEMALLAGLQRVQYVAFVPEEHDIVLAGPAGDWQRDTEGRPLAVEGHHPILQLDDLVVILRHTLGHQDARFGCSIDPTQEGLQKAQAFASESAKSPLKPGQRDAWLKQLQSAVGRQVITVYGIDPRTRVGRLLVEADYRMKLVGVGLEESVAGVPSYLASIRVEPGQAPPPMDLVRWWFTLQYDAVRATAQRDAFEIRGQGVQLQSENEFLNANGQRVQKGLSEPLNQQFARNFTEHFAQLAAKYPLYADLQNAFDLALVAALLKSENAASRVQWKMTCFLDAEQYPVALGVAPKSVDTVINHRVINQIHVVATVSGGVRVDPAKFVEPGAIQTDTYGLVSAARASAVKRPADRHRWWWD